jgi:hypothetical protein
MPHFGQVPGTSLSTPGHIGQKYAAPLRRAALAVATMVAGSTAWQQSCAATGAAA